MVFRVERFDRDTVLLYGVDSEYFEDQELPRKRRAYERHIKKHVDEAQLYLGVPLVLIRADEASLAEINDIVTGILPEEIDWIE